MWFMKWSNDEKLKAIHWMMCFLNLTIILFISVIMYITTLRICDMYEARTFLSTYLSAFQSSAYYDYSGCLLSDSSVCDAAAASDLTTSMDWREAFCWKPVSV